MSRGGANPETPGHDGHSTPPRPPGSVVDTTDILTDPGLTLVRAWEAWRGAALLPSRADMRLEDISGLLSNIALLEVYGPDEVIIRLAGTRICEVFGRELKGTNYLDFVAPEGRRLRAQRLQWQVTQPCGALVHSTHRARSGMSFRSEQVGLPIRPVVAGAPMQIIGVAAALPGQPRPTHMPEDELGRLAETFRFLDIGAGVPNGAD